MARRRRRKRRYIESKTYHADNYEGLRTNSICVSAVVSKQEFKFSKADMDIFFEKTGKKEYKCISVNARVFRANGDRGEKTNLCQRDIRGKRYG